MSSNRWYMSFKNSTSSLGVTVDENAVNPFISVNTIDTE